MRAESAGARTWLLGGVALWALATWLLGLFGLGGRIDRLPPDPALVQGLPAAPQPGDGRLGPMAQYAEFGDRPLFTTDRRPQPFVINPESEDAPAEFEFVLTSVLLTPGLEMAIVQPSGGGGSVRMKKGESADAVPGWQLVSVAPRSAVFQGPQGERTLELRVFDGVGGEAPTVMSAPAVRPSERPATASASTPQPAAGSGAGARRVPVDPASPPAPTPAPAEAPAPAQPATDAAAPAEPAEPTARTNDEQVEAIRARIEARRARLREQAQQDR